MRLQKNWQRLREYLKCDSLANARSKEGKFGRAMAEMFADFPVSPPFIPGPDPKPSQPPPRANRTKVLTRKQTQFKTSILTNTGGGGRKKKKQKNPKKSHNFRAGLGCLSFANLILFACLLEAELGPSIPRQCPFKQTPPNTPAINSTEVEMAGCVSMPSFVFAFSKHARAFSPLPPLFPPHPSSNAKCGYI